MNHDLTGANLMGANLNGAHLSAATLSRANLSGTIVTWASFDSTTSRGFTETQLQSTASYQNGDLTGVKLSENDLAGWRFVGQNLAFSDFLGATLLEAEFDGATVAGARFSTYSSNQGVGTGLTSDQLYTTASYGQRDLHEFKLSWSDISGWDFKWQDLRAADLVAMWGAANFESANLSGAYLGPFAFGDGVMEGDLGGSNMSGANLRNTVFVQPRYEPDVSPLTGTETFSSDTIYNQWTRFPDDFDPEFHGLTFVESAVGDVDGVDGLSVTDVDFLSRRIRSHEFGSGGPYFMPWQFLMFDLNGDAAIDVQDLHQWVKDLKQTWFGDANLDGEFNSADLVTVFQAGQYEDKIFENSTWATGDWNGDGEFTSVDFVVAFQDGGYEQGTRPSVRAVPEPKSILLLSTGLTILAVRRQRRKRCSLPRFEGECGDPFCYAQSKDI